MAMGLVMGAILLSATHYLHNRFQPVKKPVFPQPGGIEVHWLNGHKCFVEVIYSPYQSTRGQDDPPVDFPLPYLRFRLQYKIVDREKLKAELEATRYGIEPNGVFVASFGVSVVKADAYPWEGFRDRVKEDLLAYILANP